MIFISEETSVCIGENEIISGVTAVIDAGVRSDINIVIKYD